MAIDLAKLKTKLDKFEKKECANGCVVFDKKPDNDGYIRLSLRKIDLETGQKYTSSISMQRAVILCKENIQDLPLGLTASHLCHNTLCCREDHLSLEPHQVNCERRTCKLHKKCYRHGFHPDCVNV